MFPISYTQHMFSLRSKSMSKLNTTLKLSRAIQPNHDNNVLFSDKVSLSTMALKR